MADGIIFERLGVPAVSIVTDAFRPSSDAMARLEGAPGYRYVMVPHPLSNLDAEQCHDRAREIFPEVLAILGLGDEPVAAPGTGAEPHREAATAAGAARPEPGRVAIAELREVIEYYYDQGWTDGLPVAPVGPDTVDAFIEAAGRNRDDPVVSVEHLAHTCTVELAAVAAAMAGCQPEHFPVVLAIAEAMQPLAATGLFQSTTGQALFAVVNGPIRERLGFNSAGNVFGPGFRANATVGRAIRLIIMNVLGIRPGAFDQSTQGTPLKFGLCIAENEEQSPFEPLHIERGFAPGDDVVTVHLARSTLHVENRSSAQPEAVLATLADAMSYAGAAGCRAATVVLGPEHARLLAKHGWTKARVKEALFEQWGKRVGELRRLGLHQDDVNPEHSLTATAPGASDDTFLHFGDSPESILLVVAGAPNAGVSTVVPAHRPQRHDVAFHSRRIVAPPSKS